MRSVFWKRLGLAAAAVAVVIGCSSVLTTDDSTGGTGSGSSFSRVESDFSDDPASPGGTGGVVTEEPELAGEETRSFFKSFQIDPPLEDSAGPKFISHGDFDQDGLEDLVSGWNQSQPVQIHLQRRGENGTISFRTITLAGTTPVGVMAGVEVGQINDDGWLDVVVLVKATGFGTFCPQSPLQPCSNDLDCNPSCATDPNCEITVTCGGVAAGVCDAEAQDLSRLDGAILVYFNPGSANLVPDGDSWTEMEIINRYVADIWIHHQWPGKEEKDFEVLKTQPEWGGYTALAVAEIDGVPGDEIITALNPAECEFLGQKPPINTIDLWINPGPGLAEQADLWGAPDPNNPGRRVPLAIMADVPQVKDVVTLDVDLDGDLDIIASYTNALSLNLRWSRNPLIPHQPGGPSGHAAVVAGTSDGFRLFESEWQGRPIGQVDSHSDVMALGDVDGDGFTDIVLRSALGQTIVWFRQPNPLVVEPEFPPNDTVPDRLDFPWPVFVLADLSGKEPEGIGVGDLTNDGRVEVVAAAAGSVFWYDGTTSASVYDRWFSNTITDDGGNDLDGDGVQDGDDGCPTDPNKLEPGVCGCGFADPDCSAPNLTVRATHVNTLLVIDLDNDGRNDILATLDRRNGAGLNDDEIVWYRNVRTEEDETTTRPAGDKPGRRPVR